MSKMATLFEDKKTAKILQVIYFTAKTNEPLQLKTKVNELTTKVYKKREHEVRHVQNGSGVHIDMNPLNKKIKRWRPGVHIDMNPGLEPTIHGK